MGCALSTAQVWPGSGLSRDEAVHFEITTLQSFPLQRQLLLSTTVTHSTSL